MAILLLPFQPAELFCSTVLARTSVTVFEGSVLKVSILYLISDFKCNSFSV